MAPQGLETLVVHGHCVLSSAERSSVVVSPAGWYVEQLQEQSVCRAAQYVWVPSLACAAKDPKAPVWSYQKSEPTMDPKDMYLWYLGMFSSEYTPFL